MSNEKRSISGNICCPKCKNQFFLINLELEYDLPLIKTSENISTTRVESKSTKEGPKHQQEYLREKDVSAMTGISVSTLRNQWWKMKGLPYIKMGGSIIYRRKDIVEYLESHLISPRYS